MNQQSTEGIVLSAQGLIKRFGGITATNNVTLDHPAHRRA